jgi:hypothetical protein
MTYHVMCRVSGGRSGTRTALLKDNGTVVVFNTYEEAQKEAHRLQRAMNTEYSVALFEYWVVSA